MKRMRIAAGVLEIIKAEDPDTAVTLSYIRRIISTGKVPVTNVGSKKLVDADQVIAFITAGESKAEIIPMENRIRRVNA